MALLYRVVVFGKPKGPWRFKRRDAQQDAIELDLGGYDEWGSFYISVPADIEWMREEQVRLSA
jgi:hypothetical protein